MRIDSCRNCGKSVSAIKYCEICKQPKLLRCDHCSKFVDDPIHSKCESVSVGCS